MNGIAKKITLPVLLLFACIPAFAQPTQEEKRILFDKIDTLLSNYISYSRFLVNTETEVSKEAIDKFKKLFVSGNVTLPDEMSPLYFDTRNNTKPRFPSSGSMDGEVLKTKDKIPRTKPGATNSLSKLNAASDSLNFYLNELNQGRESFYREYENLTTNISSYYTAIKNQEKVITRTLDEFIVMVELNYAEGFSVKLLNSVVSFRDMAKNEVKVLLRKKTYGKLSGSGVKLENTDTLLMTLKVSEGYSKLLISNIEMIGYKLDFLNDNDRDFIANPIDACPDEQAMFQTTGCPPAAEKKAAENMSNYVKNRNTDSLTAKVLRRELDVKINEVSDKIAGLERLINAPPHWMIVLGASTGLTTAKLTNAAGNYLSNNTSREINPATTFATGRVIGIDLMGEHYFGKNSNFGIGAGFAFNSISTNIEKSAFRVEYKGVDEGNGNRKGGNAYTQIISSTGSIREKVNISNFSIPAMAIYKGNVTKALGFKLEAGIALNLLYKSTMNSTNAAFDYEAVYKYGNTDPQDFFDPRTSLTATGYDPTSWLITKDAVDRLNIDRLNYFNAMQGNNYPVGLNQGPKNTNSSATFQPGISFIFRPSVSFYFNKGATLNLGVFYSITQLTQRGDYRLINERGQYNTLMQGVSKASNTIFGIHISYSYSLFYYLSKWKKELSGLR